MILDSSDSDLINFFNRKVDRLTRTLFAHWCFERSSGNIGPSMKMCIDMRDNNKSVKIESFIPDEDDIDAFLFTFRFFLQKRDCNVWDFAKIYSKLPLQNKERQNFSDIITDINACLNSDSGISEGSSADSIHWTNEQIMENILYGYLAHENEDKRLIVNGWKEDPVLWLWIFDLFIRIIEFVFGGLMQIQYLNKSLLEDKSLW